ncbi:ExeM/NucH family extracellular endonuclease [Aquincola sp. MAHUQ-54]|uniref:ExeM/NucH family extracellular endonuclease n=1 Tax=Aquincola agrisoli TaxID=3119538 RepID=A0AAW9QHG0_9BURK
MKLPSILLAVAGLAGAAVHADAEGLVAIPALQGRGATSPWAGQRVATQGTVTLVTGDGFFLQDPAGDGDPLTSDGIRVRAGHVPGLAAGRRVRVTGTVAELAPEAARERAAAGRTTTVLTSAGAVRVAGAGAPVAAVDVDLQAEAEGGLERYEGMLVRLAGPLTVSDPHALGRFGQLILSAGGRLEAPTHRHPPGPQARALARDNARRRIVLDEGSLQPNPPAVPYLGEGGTVRAGDRVEAVTGVLDEGPGAPGAGASGGYRIHPAVPPRFVRAHARTAAPAAVGGNVKVAVFNLQNYFTTFSDGRTADGRAGQGCTRGGQRSAADCRGAGSLGEFRRQQAKLVAALRAIDADVVGLVEIENNGPVAVQNLVDALNAAMGAGTYAAVPDPPATGTDAIKVAMIHKPRVLGRVGAARADASPVHDRPPLAQAFSFGEGGERFTVVVGHFKSKRCEAAAGADADLGDGQGCHNGRRVRQAQAVADFLDTAAAAAGTAGVLLVGDLNAHPQEDPAQVLAARGYVDVAARHVPPPGHTYVFGGEAGRLDHAWADAALAARVSGAAVWHINADEPAALDYRLAYRQPACAACAPDLYRPGPFRASDHDPVIVGLALRRGATR